MDESRLERIDRYLRGEMSPGEMADFEQEVIDDDGLRRELELTYSIKRSLTRRGQKLHQTGEWLRKRRRRYAYAITLLSMAAMLVVGLFVYRNWETDNAKRQLLAMKQQLDSVEQQVDPQIRTHGREDYVALVKADVGHKSYKEAVARVEIMEHNNEIPTLDAMADDAARNRTYAATPDSGLVSYDSAYELHWLKICSMAKLGETDNAVKSLRTFTTLEGKYKLQADTLLMELEREEKRQ